MSDYRENCLNKKGYSCYICGESNNIDVHHIDGDRTNNQLKNLIPICRYCHIGIHKARENYKHWYNRLLPWYTNSDREYQEEYSTNEEDVSTRRLVDDLIFLENLSSSVARQLVEMENGDLPFQCPKCGVAHTLGTEYSLKNREFCSNCNWSGAVYKGTIEAINQSSEFE
jgi:hypothetical protein